MPRFKIILGRVCARPGMFIETDADAFIRRHKTRLQKVSETNNSETEQDDPANLRGEIQSLREISTRLQQQNDELREALKEEGIEFADDVPPPSPGPKTALPSSFPGYSSLTAVGFQYYEDLVGIDEGSLEMVQGIGEKTASQITTEVNKWRNPE